MVYLDLLNNIKSFHKDLYPLTLAFGNSRVPKITITAPINNPVWKVYRQVLRIIDILNILSICSIVHCHSILNNHVYIFKTECKSRFLFLIRLYDHRSWHKWKCMEAYHLCTSLNFFPLESNAAKLPSRVVMKHFQKILLRVKFTSDNNLRKTKISTFLTINDIFDIALVVNM